MGNREYCEDSHPVNGKDVKSINIREMIPGISYHFDGKRLHVSGFIDYSQPMNDLMIWENPTGKYLHISYSKNDECSGTTVFAKIHKSENILDDKVNVNNRESKSFSINQIVLS